MRRKTKEETSPPPQTRKAFHLEWKNSSQKIAYMAFEQHDVLFLSGPAGTAKANSLDTLVYTPNGPKRMGDIKLGDLVCTPDGGESKVTGVFPQGEKDIYKVVFSDGDSVECCDEHLWRVSSLQNGWSKKVLTTQEIRESVKTVSGRRKYSIQVPKSVKFKDSPLKIPPYMMGVLLGDGSFRSNSLRISTTDKEILENLMTNLDTKNYYIRNLDKTSSCDYVIKNKNKGNHNNYINALKEYGLWNLASHEKFIPIDYIYNSELSRLDVIQGLMDTDGTVDKKTGQAVFCTTSYKMALNFKELICSIGGLCSIVEGITYYKYKDIRKKGKPSYKCYIKINDPSILFSLSRKKVLTIPRTKYLVKRVIDKIEYVGKKHAQCIMIDHPDHLYLVDNFVVTHNTHLAVAFAIGEIIAKRRKKIVLTRPIVEAGEKLGFLPGPQPVDAKVLTPNGWVAMGELKVGNEVIGRDGLPSKIMKILPQGKKKVYKIITTEGSSTEACEDHLWLTRTWEDKKRGRSGTIKTTKEISGTLINKKGKLNHYLPRNEPVKFNSKPLPLSPYTLGVLLGDGCITERVGFCSIDTEISERVNKEVELVGCQIASQGKTINYSIKSKSLISKKPARKVKFTNVSTGDFEEFPSISAASQEKGIPKLTLAHRCRRNSIMNEIKYEFLPLEKRWTNPVKNIVNDLGLLGKKASNKFIPNIYKFASIQDRINLLRGLMDTDGTIKKTGEASFSTISKRLAKDVIELVQSLGGRALLRERKRKDSVINGRKIPSNISYEFTISLPNYINPFYVSRKSSKFKSNFIHSARIKSVEPIHEKEVQCILLDNEEHLYITDQYIVTHNTFEEKINPYLMPIFDCMDTIIGRDTLDRERVNRSLEIVPIAYARGRTFHDSVIIFDEAQNATDEQLKLVLTRLGENSKIIITGDPTQSDLKTPEALTGLVQAMKGVPGISVVEFNESCIVRHPLVAEILAAWPSK